MAKLIWVGENWQNVKGKSSKGYCICRAGRSVKILYGSVEVRGGGGGKVFWIGSYPRIHKKKLRSEKQAAAFVKRQIDLKVAKGYGKLPGRVKIG